MLAEQGGHADKALARAQRCIAGVIVVELGADGPFAILLFQRGADAHEFIAIGGKDGGDDARLGRVAVDQGRVEVEHLAAVGQRGRGLAGDGHHGTRVDRERAGKFGREQAREAGGLVDHGRVEHFRGRHDAIEFAGDGRFGALFQRSRSADADQGRQAGEDQADEGKRKHGNLAADTPVAGGERNCRHSLSLAKGNQLGHSWS
ncbi:hypothetical protein D3C81_1434910 [compost metagenome]